MCFQMHQNPTAYADDHQQGSKHPKRNRTGHSHQQSEKKTPNPEHLVLMHQFIVLMIETCDVAFHSHSDLHSPMPVGAEFCIDNTQKVVVDDHRGGSSPIRSLRKGVFHHLLAVLSQHRSSPDGEPPCGGMIFFGRLFFNGGFLFLRSWLRGARRHFIVNGSVDGFLVWFGFWFAKGICIVVEPSLLFTVAHRIAYKRRLR